MEASDVVASDVGFPFTMSTLSQESIKRSIKGLLTWASPKHHLRITALAILLLAALKCAMEYSRATRPFWSYTRLNPLISKLATRMIPSKVGQNQNTLLQRTANNHIKHAYSITRHELHVDLICATLSPHAQTYLKQLARILREHDSPDSPVSHLSLSVTCRSEPLRGENSAKDFVSHLLSSLARQESRKKYTLFEYSRTGYRLLSTKQQAEGDVPLSDEQIALCRDIGVVLGAWYASPFLQKYEFGQVFAVDFYAGLLLFSKNEEWLAHPFSALTQEAKNQVCLGIAEATGGQPLYKIPLQQLDSCETWDDSQLNSLWNLSVKGFIFLENFKKALQDAATKQWICDQIRTYTYETYCQSCAPLHAVAQGFQLCPQVRRNILWSESTSPLHAAQRLSNSIQGPLISNSKTFSTPSESKKD